MPPKVPAWGPEKGPRVCTEADVSAAEPVGMK